MRLKLSIILVLIAITLAAYWRTANNEFISFDDNDYVYENTHVKAGLNLDSIRWAFTTTEAANWHPLTWLSHTADYQIYGMNPRGHHLTSVFLHILNAMLLFLVFVRMTGALWRSAFVAALFALHPLHVESVAWASERKDVLSALFFMLTLLAYHWYTERPGAGRYLTAFVTFALGLMAKPMLVTLPFVLLLLDYWPLGRFGFMGGPAAVKSAERVAPKPGAGSPPASRLILEKVPFLFLSVSSCIVTFYIQNAGGTVSSLEKAPFADRFANVLTAYAGYLGKTFWPGHLVILYPFPVQIEIWKVAVAVLLLGIVSAAVFLRRRLSPFLPVGWLWFLGTLVPVIGLVQVGVQAMADRYTYIPLIGVFLMISWGVPETLGNWRYRRLALAISASIIILACTVTTWLQTGHWHTSEELYRHTLKFTTGNFTIMNSLGERLIKQGKLDEAIDRFHEAYRLKPDDVFIQNNLAVALSRQGKIDEAISQLNRALQIRPDYAKLHINLGVALGLQGRSDEAIGHLREALRLEPDDTTAHVSLGNALAKQGLTDEAFRHFREALRLNPDDAAAHYNLGEALANQVILDEAVIHLQEALRLDPSLESAHVKLGLVLFKQGKAEEAIGHYKEALRLKPEDATAHNDLGGILAARGDLAGAVDHFSAAVRISPNFREAGNNLAIVSAARNKKAGQ